MGLSTVVIKDLFSPLKQKHIGGELMLIHLCTRSETLCFFNTKTTNSLHFSAELEAEQKNKTIFLFQFSSEFAFWLLTYNLLY